jgi:hypothetical protein
MTVVLAPLARALPSGLRATANTVPGWVRVLIVLLVLGFHSWTESWLLPVATRSSVGP